MQKILLLIPSMAGIGGTERMVNSLSKILASDERQVYQASFDSPSSIQNFDNTMSFYRLGPIPRLPLLIRPYAYALSAWRLNRLKRQLDIDITISNLWGADLINILSGGRDKKIALCHINIIGNTSNKLMVKFRPFVAAIYRCFNKVIAVSESLAVELRDFYRLPLELISHINNFSDKVEAISCIPNDGLQRFVWCGRFSPEKNIEGLLHAWAAFTFGRSSEQLILLGDGVQLSEMRILAHHLKLRCGTGLNDVSAQVIFMGQVSEPASYLVGAKALLLASVSEGLPMVVLEALALGVPVLAADCPAGGVRAALLGRGQHDANRVEPEDAPAGILLPVPLANKPASLQLWMAALRRASDDFTSSHQWQRGALDRAQMFSSSTAKIKWEKLLAAVS